MCNSRRRVNRVEAEKVQSSLRTEIYHIVLDQEDDSKLEYGVLSITSRRIGQIVQICSLELPKSNRDTPRKLSVMLRSYGKSFYATVDTGSPVSFLNKRMADVLLRQNPKSRFIYAHNMNDDISFVDYNKNSIKTFGSLTIPVSSGGWKKDFATFLVSENKTRCLLGLDLQRSLGIDTVQRNPPQVKRVWWKIWWKT